MEHSSTQSSKHLLRILHCGEKLRGQLIWTSHTLHIQIRVTHLNSIDLAFISDAQNAYAVMHCTC